LWSPNACLGDGALTTRYGFEVADPRYQAVDSCHITDYSTWSCELIRVVEAW
jgi:hypothetical protein